MKWRLINGVWIDVDFTGTRLINGVWVKGEPAAGGGGTNVVHKISGPGGIAGHGGIAGKHGGIAG